MPVLRVAVVGSGAIGLSAALELSSRLSNIEIEIIAESFPPNTTSDGAGGFLTLFLAFLKLTLYAALWRPIYLQDTPERDQQCAYTCVTV